MGNLIKTRLNKKESNKLDFIKTKELIEEYEEWNNNRKDGLIIHTDCLDDFINWLNTKEKEKMFTTIKRMQEVVDAINDKGDINLSIKQFMSCDIPEDLKLEIIEDTYDDTDQFDQILYCVSQKFTEMNWPLYGDTDIIKKNWETKMYKSGLFKKRRR